MGLTVEAYGALIPFAEYIRSDGATAPGFVGGASQVDFDAYTGFNAKPRFRMTSGTSDIGFRGTFEFSPQLKLTWQVESLVPVDGNGPSSYTFASRNTHIGFTGGWGTLVFGNWDTPWKWATLVTINPMPGAFAGDYTSIISTPGFGVAAINSTSLLQGSISNAAFYRRAPNSFQYWSPNVAGFTVRLMAAFNEERSNPEETLGPGTNPYLLSGYLGFDGGGLRVRYAAEIHKDYFGMSQLGGTTPAPSDTVTSSTDVGHQLTVQYALTVSPAFRTRLVGTGELLTYQQQDSTVDAINRYSRFAFYALLEQKLFSHRVWAAYGQDLPGECRRVGGNPCTTIGLGARLATLGYLYTLNDNTMIFLTGYRIFNDASANHSTFPILQPDAPGADITAFGLGIFYSFAVSYHR